MTQIKFLNINQEIKIERNILKIQTKKIKVKFSEIKKFRKYIVPDN